MIHPLFNRTDIEASGLLEVPSLAAFRSDPVGLIDVGARWGPSEIFRATPQIIDVLAFEADVEEAEKLETVIGGSGEWAGFTVHRGALGPKSGTGTLRLLSKPNNSSLLPSNPHFTGRYAFRGFDLVREVDIALESLDSVLFDGNAPTRAGEILKVDVQGGELSILSGATRTLMERSVCVICEVAFFPFYDGMPLLPDVAKFLMDKGFSLYGLLDAQNRSTKRLDKATSRARERLCHADAVFLRDPLDHPEGISALSERRLRVLLLAAILLGYLDFALEMAAAGAVPASELAGFTDAVRRLATVDPEGIVSDVEALAARARHAPAMAHVELARLVDRLRDFQTVHDVPRET